MQVAIIGAGVNGICAALALAERGCSVSVYERSSPFAETSSRSSKMLHGGIRYLEQGHFKLVREALADRAWWLKHASESTKISRFYIPIYKNGSRTRLKLFLGVKFYEYLAGRYPSHKVPVLSSLIVFGAAIEVAQAATGWRYGEWGDLLADAIGVFSGWLLARVLVRRLNY